MRARLLTQSTEPNADGLANQMLTLMDTPRKHVLPSSLGSLVLDGKSKWTWYCPLSEMEPGGHRGSVTYACLTLDGTGPLDHLSSSRASVVLQNICQKFRVLRRPWPYNSSWQPPLQDKYLCSYVRIQPYGFCGDQPLTLSLPWNTLAVFPESMSLKSQFLRPNKHFLFAVFCVSLVDITGWETNGTEFPVSSSTARNSSKAPAWVHCALLLFGGPGPWW